MKAENENQIEPAPDRFLIRMPSFVTIGLCAFWMGAALVSVSFPMSPHDPGEKYGWSVPFGIAVMIFPIAIYAYQWGRNDAARDPTHTN